MSGSSRKPSVNVDEAAQICGVSRRMIYYWLKAGRIQRAPTPDYAGQRGARIVTASLSQIEWETFIDKE
jgi:predicted site-specific integrase-resolvase